VIGAFALVADSLLGAYHPCDKQEAKAMRALAIAMVIAAIGVASPAVAASCYDQVYKGQKSCGRDTHCVESRKQAWKACEEAARETRNIQRQYGLGQNIQKQYGSDQKNRPVARATKPKTQKPAAAQQRAQHAGWKPVSRPEFRRTR